MKIETMCYKTTSIQQDTMIAGKERNRNHVPIDICICRMIYDPFMDLVY